MTLSPWIDALGWTLVHFVWQAAAIAALVAVVLRVTSTRASQLRYLICCTALLLMLAAAGGTFFWQWSLAGDRLAAAVHNGPATSTAINSHAGTLNREPDARQEPQFEISPSKIDGAAGKSALERFYAIGHRLVEWLSPWMRVLVAIWASGVGLLSIRLGFSWRAVRDLRSAGLIVDNPSWTRALARLCNQIGVSTHVRLLRSSAISVPMVAGWMKPAILVPMELVMGLPANQIDAILAHELAHIRRHDYLVNLLQNLLETLLFFHPAVWWLSAQVRREREFCCDDIAASLCDNTATYVRALTAAETIRSVAPALAVAATGGSLLDRVRRLARQEPAPVAGGAAAGTAALACSLTLLYALTTFGSDGTAKDYLSPAEATSLAVEAHRAAAELNKLPRFLVEFTHRNADVTTMNKVPEASIENLRRAIDGPVDENKWIAMQHTLAWDPERMICATAYSRRRTVDSGPYTRNTGEVRFIDGGSEYFGTKSMAWGREHWDDTKPTRYFRRKTMADFATNMLTTLDLEFLKVTPREFWWGNNLEPNTGHSPVPPTMVDYTYVGPDKLGGELCDVVESKGRGERLWIGRDSGRIRGSLQFFYQGRSPGIEGLPATRATVERFAGHPIASDEDYRRWSRDGRKKLTSEQQGELTKAWNEDCFDSKMKGFVRRPGSFVVYSDYRQIAPGVMLPFREDRSIWLHEGEQFKYARCETVIERVDFDDDLPERLAALMPKEGDSVQDQRFGFPAEYEYQPNLSEEEIQVLVEAKKLEADLRAIRNDGPAAPATQAR